MAAVQQTFFWRAEAVPASGDAVLREDGGYVLRFDGGKVLREGEAAPPPPPGDALIDTLGATITDTLGDTITGL